MRRSARLFCLLGLLALLGGAAGCNEDDDEFLLIPIADEFGFTGSFGNSGDEAVDYLSNSPFTSLAVEIDVIDFKPGNGADEVDPSTINLLDTRLTDRCNKPVGINVFTNDLIPTSSPLFRTVYTIQDLINIENAHRTFQDTSNQKTLYIIVVNGDSEFDDQNQKVLGLAFSASSIAIFRENIEDVAPLPKAGNIPAIENSVYVHEAGHNLGLVNNGINMVTQHEDPDHQHHDINSNCVMFFAVEAGLGISTPPNDFDQNCINDMVNVGGKP